MTNSTPVLSKPVRERKSMKKTGKRMFYSIAYCDECKAEWEGFDNRAERLTSSEWATRHARLTSHNVTVEQNFMYQVLGRGL